jgi:DNA primase catalytic core
MARIPNTEIDRIISGSDFLALVRARGIAVRKHGLQWLGRCPFHGESEDSSSLILNPAKGLYHCMACSAAGNAIQFVEKFDGVSFRHAFELLANGSAFEQAPDRVIKAGTVRKLECPLDPDASDAELTVQVTDYYHERLFALENARAREMLEVRGLWNEEAVKRFRIGFADRTLGLRLPPKNRRDGAALRERLMGLGLYRGSGHEHFNGSIIIPIEDAAGNVVEIYGRKITQALRKGTPNHLYLPGPHAGIWNAAALDAKEVILCEAPLDALTFYVRGIENVTFIFGTKGFTGELLDALVSNKIERVKIAYDADEAGDSATERDAEMLTAKGIEVFRVRFPAGMDANDYGNPALHPDAAVRLATAVNSAHWLGRGSCTSLRSYGDAQKSGVSPAPTSSLITEFGCSGAPFAAEGTPLDRAKMENLTTEIQPDATSRCSVAEREGEHWSVTIGDRRYRISGLEKNAGFDSLKITLRLWFDNLFHLDSLDLCADAQRRKFIERAAAETTLDSELIKRDLGKLLLVIERIQEDRLRDEAQTATRNVEITPEERRAADELLRSPDLIERIGRDFESCGVVGEENNRLVGYLACTSRLLRHPLAVVIQSTSAAGKSTLMDAILAMFPQEERIKYSAMTGQSLYYLGSSNLKHKILAIVEEEGAERASYALKLLQSEGEITIASTGKNSKTGQMETHTYRVEGPVMIFLTTTAIGIDEELQNRCLTLSVDESPEQTQRIHQVQRTARTLAGIERSDAKDSILRAHRNAQRLLENLPVWNPFVEQLTFTSERTRTRRDHEKYLTLIDTVTLLHQRQRERVTLPSGRQALAATLEDIRIANRLAPEVLGRSLDELPPHTRKLWDAIKTLAADDWKRFTFTRRALRESIGWSVTQTRVHLERLHELEYVVPRQGRNGLRFEYGIIIDPRAADSIGHIGLIDPANLQFRLQPDGGNPHPVAPDKTPVSGSIPYGNELSAAPDGLPESRIRDTGKAAVAS